ncbi:SLC13 family permease [Haematobacter genomosp. 1]|uniref:SLC13 family permease n=1 Tax=Haematobacter genomosp. 1 TaxID=366618 RepID=A0A212ABN3_9RHOB|nr:SLC13 family permease [Haematobacter genomosp. 1]OWJ77907.1 SLC13 family permease [Haematobacter genomosp. 1]
MSDIWIVFAIIAAVIVLFVWDRLPVIIVCIGCALALWATGILTIGQSLAGFGDPATIFVASLFVVSAGMERSGVTAWVGQMLIDKSGNSRVRLIVFMTLSVAVLSALISVNGAVAALLPVVVVLAVRLGRAPGRLLMPLVFGAHSGSMLLLTGTPVNVLISEALADFEGRSFGYFEFALVGIPLVLGGVLISVLLGESLLPARSSKTLPTDLSRHASTLVEQYRLSSEVQTLRIREDSPLVGTSRRALDLSDREGLALVSVTPGGEGTSGQRAQLNAGDIVVVRGESAAVGEFAQELGLVMVDAVSADETTNTLFNRNSALAEVVIKPRSPLIGERFFPGMVTPSGDLIVLAIQRQGKDLTSGDQLASGDTLLLQGTWEAMETRLEPAEVLVVDSPELVRRQALPMGPGAQTTLLILAGMVILLATGLVPPAVAGLLAAGAFVLTGILSVDQVYRSISWTTVILVGAMMPLSVAIQQTGAAQLLAEKLVAVVGQSEPRMLLAGLFVLTAILGQVISNTATALIIIPIAVVTAKQMGISPEPVLMSVGVAAAASFLTPVATPTNLMVMEPGSYKFTDYWKFGLPFMLWFFVVAVFWVPVIWSF